MANYYEELGVPTTADKEEIHKAYKYLARKYHPDVYIGDKEIGRKKMVAVNEAYATLSDGNARAAYDRKHNINQAAANYYEELGIEQNATQDEIHTAYKLLARKYHPDLYQGDKSVGAHKMSLVNNAYDVLSDKEKREKYDRKLSGNYSVDAPKKFPLIPIIAAVTAVVITAIILIVVFTREDKVPSYTITYTVENAEQCSLEGELTQKIKKGSAGSAVRVAPKAGYAFLMWSDGKTENPRYDRNVTADANIYAICAVGHNIKFTAGANGDVVVKINDKLVFDSSKTTLSVSWEDFIAEGIEINVTASPKNSLYEFEGWSDGWVDVNGKANSTRTFIVGGAIEATAKFKLKPLQ